MAICTIEFDAASGSLSPIWLDEEHGRPDFDHQQNDCVRFGRQCWLEGALTKPAESLARRNAYFQRQLQLLVGCVMTSSSSARSSS